MVGDNSIDPASGIGALVNCWANTIRLYGDRVGESTQNDGEPDFLRAAPVQYSATA